jgi:phosphocarrier protein
MVGILIVAHTPVATAMLGFAEHTFGLAPERVRAVDIPPYEDTKASFDRVMKAAYGVNSGHGVLILTDVMGATPANVASKLEAGDCVSWVKSTYADALHFSSWRELRAVSSKSASRRPKWYFAFRLKSLTRNYREIGFLMPVADIEIINKLGLHARASAKLSQLAAQFPCEILLSRNGRQINAKSIMGVMMLAAGIGSTVTLETVGEQEDEAMQALTALINDRFGEGV